MGSAEKASDLLHYWIGQHRPEFDLDATSSFEATVAHSIQEITTGTGVCGCKLLVTTRLQNNYGGLNGGCMAGLVCILAGAALETVSARSGIVTSSSIECLSAMPGDAVVEVVAKVQTVTNASASVDVILQNATSHKMIAKGRYTEQAPHIIRARASAYFNMAATAAKSAVHRLQTAAGSALQRNASSAASSSEQTESADAESDQTQDIRRKAMASLTSAGATVKAAAHRLQVAADNVLRSSSGDAQLVETNSAENSADSTEAGDSPTTDIANQVTAAASAASAKGQAAISSSSAVIQGAASATSAKLQAAAQPIADAMSSLQPPSISEQPNTHSQTSTAESEGHGAASGAASGPAPDHAKQALLQRIAMVKDSYRGDDCSCFDTTVGCLLKDIQVDDGACSAVLPTSARLSDQQGHLHAGCYCSLVDLISTTALASADKRPAVTVTISVDFFAPLPIGEDLVVESHMVKAGKTLTFAEISFRQRSTGELIAQGSHVEYSAGSTPYPDTIEEYHNAKVARITSKL